MNENKQENSGLDLEDILKEFGAAEDSMSETEAAASHALQEMLDGDEPEDVDAAADDTAGAPAEEAPVSDDTIRLDSLTQVSDENAPKEPDITSETIRLEMPEKTQTTEAPPAEEIPEPEEPEIVSEAPVYEEKDMTLVNLTERQLHAAFPK